MPLTATLLHLFPEPPPHLSAVIDEALIAALMPDKPDRVKHILGVARQGRRLVAAIKASPDFARQMDLMALSHDIAYAEDLKRTGFHPLDGAVWLAHRGENEAIIEAVLYHSGARQGACFLPQIDAVYRQLPDFAPTLATDAITWCDLQTSPVGEVITMEQRVAEIESRYGVDHPVAQAMRISVPEFQEIHKRMQNRFPVLRAARPIPFLP